MLHKLKNNSSYLTIFTVVLTTIEKQFLSHQQRNYLKDPNDCVIQTMNLLIFLLSFQIIEIKFNAKMLQ